MTRPKRDSLVSGRGLLVRVERRPIAPLPRGHKPPTVIVRKGMRLTTPSTSDAVYRMLAGGPIRFPKELM